MDDEKLRKYRWTGLFPYRSTKNGASLRCRELLGCAAGQTTKRACAPTSTVVVLSRHPNPERHRKPDDMRRDIASASDANLVLSVARFDESALAELYRRHAGSVFALAKRVLRQSGLAEEVVQEVFLRLWNQPDRFDVERGSLRSYLLSIAHGRSIDLLRADGARRERERREARTNVEVDVAQIGMLRNVKANGDGRGVVVANFEIDIAER